jgi:hypothetical protein
LSDSRGRSISKWGIEDDGADRSDGAGPSERSPSSSSGCSASDAKLGLCEDDSSDLDDDPEKQALHDKEEEVTSHTSTDSPPVESIAKTWTLSMCREHKTCKNVRHRFYTGVGATC